MYGAVTLYFLQPVTKMIPVINKAKNLILIIFIFLRCSSVPGTVPWVKQLVKFPDKRKCIRLIENPINLNHLLPYLRVGIYVITGNTGINTINLLFGMRH